MDNKSIETIVLTRLLNYLVASQLLTNFSYYIETFGIIDPCIKEGNIIYVVEFNEGKKVKQFLHELKDEFTLESDILIINNMIKEWKKVIQYLLLISSEKDS